MLFWSHPQWIYLHGLSFQGGCAACGFVSFGRNLIYNFTDTGAFFSPTLPSVAIVFSRTSSIHPSPSVFNIFTVLNSFFLPFFWISLVASISAFWILEPGKLELMQKILWVRWFGIHHSRFFTWVTQPGIFFWCALVVTYCFQSFCLHSDFFFSVCLLKEQNACEW